MYLGGASTGTLIYDATYDKNGNRKDFKTASAGPVISCAGDPARATTHVEHALAGAYPQRFHQLR